MDVDKLIYDVDAELDQMIAVAIEIGNMMGGQSVPVNNVDIKYAEGIAKKIIKHSISALHLSNGYSLRVKDDTYQSDIDFSSVAVLIRAATESYLTFHYIFVDPRGNRDLQQFRFVSWHIGGFLERSDLKPKMESHRKKQAEELILLDEYRSRLRANSYFIGSTLAIQNKALKGEWRQSTSWSGLAIRAGFEDDFFRKTYSYLCAYAHCSRISVMQIQQVQQLSQQNQMVKPWKGFLILVLAKFVYDYIDLFPALSAVKEDEVKYNFISNWRKAAEGTEPAH